MNNKQISYYLNICGFISIAAGLIFAFIIIAKISEGGLLSSGDPGMGIVLGTIVLFYHVMFSLLCFGVSKILYQEKEEYAINQTSKKCPKCGTEYTAKYDGEFCDECGEKL